MEINKKDLIEWFWEKFNSCYLVKHDDYPESIFMFYDPQYIRKLKLANISGEKINKTDITGVCLFQQDWKNNIFYCDYYEIWDHLYYNYSNNTVEIQQFISDRLEEHTKMSVLTPFGVSAWLPYALEEHTKMSVLTPDVFINIAKAVLEEHTKMSVLTPLYSAFNNSYLLEEHTKMSVLTPRSYFKNASWKLEEHTKMCVLTPSFLNFT